MERAEESLFRARALEAATSRLGAPVRALGVTSWMLTAFSTLLILALVLFLSLGQYTRRETVVGMLQPVEGSARISPNRPGVISAVHVREGDLVRAGQPIATISTETLVEPDGGGSTSLSSLLREAGLRQEEAISRQAGAAAEILQQQLQELQARRAGLRADLVEIQDSIRLQDERIRLAGETLSAARSLHERELMATLQLRQREEALIAARQARESLEREARQNEASLQQLAAEEGRLNALRAQSLAELGMMNAQLDEKRADRLANRSIVLVAPGPGRVAALQARSGGFVQPGQTLAVVLPNDRSGLQAELWVPSRAAGFVEPGDRVRLMYDAFPYQKFGVGEGVVTTVSQVAINPSEVPIPMEVPEAHYRVLVRLQAQTVRGYGKTWALDPGMRLAADLVLEQRSLWEWFFDPLIALRQRSAG